MQPLLITFLSDFGTQDGYAGSVKGVLKSLVPHCEIIDISHRIPPHNIAAGAWSILNYYNRFPRGTVHLAVVDPGVGSTRRPLILQTPDYFFVGPDNGLFRFVTENKKFVAYKIKERIKTSSTFQARDLFAPTAAKLVLGIAPEELGEKLTDWEAERRPVFTINGERIKTKALAVDRFGNIISGFSKKDLIRLNFLKVRSVRIKEFNTTTIHKFYAEKHPGELLALWNSQDFLEIAVNRGNAAERLAFDPLRDTILIEIE